MRVASLLVVVVLAFGVLWLAGEQHRKNCISEGKIGCSVLPWDNGSTADSAEPGRLTPRGCALLKLRNAAAESTSEVDPVPPECR